MVLFVLCLFLFVFGSTKQTSKQARVKLVKLNCATNQTSNTLANQTSQPSKQASKQASKKLVNCNCATNQTKH
jgi:hypothetical protein